MQVQAHREQFELRLEEKDAQLKESLRQAAEVGCEAGQAMSQPARNTSLVSPAMQLGCSH